MALTKKPWAKKPWAKKPLVKKPLVKKPLVKNPLFARYFNRFAARREERATESSGRNCSAGCPAG
jgi:hypothetical protein